MLAHGCQVALQGIVSRPEINGCKGIIIGKFDAEKQRWPVLVANRRGRGEEMLLRPANLAPLTDTDTDSEGSEASDQSDSCDVSSASSCDDDVFKCEYKISQNMEQPYRGLFGAPLMSFFGSPCLFPEDLATRHTFCHSTACPLRVGVSAEQLSSQFKGAKLRTCTQCRDAWYCSKDCQAHDWVHGDHRARCAKMSSGSSKLSEACESSVESELAPARVDKAICRFTRDQAREFHDNAASGGKRVAKHVSHFTFEEKCTVEFLYSCGMMQAIMSDKFHRRTNSLPPADDNAVYAIPIEMTTNANTENIKSWLVLAGKFKSWMWRTCNEGPSLNFGASIPARFVPHVSVVVANAIGLLRSWEPQEKDNWAMQREANVMATAIAGFGHQQCFVDEILTPGSQLHCYVQLLLQWAAWRGPVAHLWSAMMQVLLSSLLSGLELSETKHASPAPVHVAVLEPVCHKFVAILAGDQSRFRTYKPMHMRQLAEMFDQCSTDSEKQQFVVDMTNDAITFFSGAATRELNACLRAHRMFPSLDLKPLAKLAAFHKKQMLSTGGIHVPSLRSHIQICEAVLACKATGGIGL
jgi:hypothetical protein